MRHPALVISDVSSKKKPARSTSQVQPKSPPAQASDADAESRVNVLLPAASGTHDEFLRAHPFIEFNGKEQGEPKHVEFRQRGTQALLQNRMQPVQSYKMLLRKYKSNQTATLPWCIHKSGPCALQCARAAKYIPAPIPLRVKLDLGAPLQWTDCGTFLTRVGPQLNHRLRANFILTPSLLRAVFHV
jgi:hypothetical protein